MYYSSTDAPSSSDFYINRFTGLWLEATPKCGFLTAILKRLFTWFLALLKIHLNKAKSN